MTLHLAIQIGLSFIFKLCTTQLSGGLFDPSEKRGKISHTNILHFLFDMGMYNQYAKIQGVFPKLLRESN